MKKGDHVIVELPMKKPYKGVIIGEGRQGTWWRLLKDGTNTPRDIHKSYCKPETPDEA